METPAGRIRFDETTGHFIKHVYIGRVNHEGQFDVVNHWNNGQMVLPDPFPYPDLVEEFVG